MSGDNRKITRATDLPESLQGRIEAAKAVLSGEAEAGPVEPALGNAPGGGGHRVIVRIPDLTEPLQPRAEAAKEVLRERAKAGSEDAMLMEAKARAQIRPVQPSRLLLEVCLKLKTHRLHRKLKLSDVATKSGMDSATLSRLENGRLANPTLSTLQRYSAAIGLRLKMDVAAVGTEAEASYAPAGYPVKFIHEEAAVEALRERWYQGERAGRDVGQAAIRDWIDRHWNGFLRARWLEHMEGKTYWAEIDADDFGILTRLFRGSPYLDKVVEQLKAGGENLSILAWAHKQGLSDIEIDDIVAILQEIDVNRIRIKHQLDRLLV